MIESEQKKLFTRIRKRFQNRSKKWCSGYLHGILDEAKRKKPDRVYLTTCTQVYSQGYLWGFLDARGEDAFEWVWARQLTPTRKALQFRWWYKQEK